ncbi:hypothetical protein DIE20_11545 [Burkholderia sp. Bp9131]|uniref:hypothetical protein n=1 Tax=Burkholderia sp. Bp9131 TaxID=2184571 RepID=UPI000F55BB02|nr:hypothetical protein [Burkholderia sp. Bp9131]RQR43490.1 hypothetical protein DIE20_11545 [Burkholderia sp. Bp9131]
MLHEERVLYGTIKEWALETYFNFCRDRALVLKMSQREVMGYVDYEYEEAFERPIEQLMFRIVELILSGGWNDHLAKYFRESAETIITEHGLESLLEGVPEEEAGTFKHDLRILKFI